MYYENPEINDDRQYADFCLDNNGKSICKTKDKSINFKKSIFKIAKEYDFSVVSYKSYRSDMGYQCYSIECKFIDGRVYSFNDGYPVGDYEYRIKLVDLFSYKLKVQRNLWLKQ